MASASASWFKLPTPKKAGIVLAVERDLKGKQPADVSPIRYPTLLKNPETLARKYYPMLAEEWPAARAIEPTAASSLWKGTLLRGGREGFRG